MDKEQFGAFVAERRKSLNLTQKELADRLRISDKAISKWERGLSYPDITMLEPLAAILSVSLTELIEGRNMEIGERIEKKEVEAMLQHTMELNNEERARTASFHKKERICTIVSIIAASLAECSLLFFLDTSWETVLLHLPTVMGLVYFFGIYFWVIAKEELPAYYDEKKITEYRDGGFSMNMPGVSFNNHNWKHILHALRLWTMIVALVYPPITILMDIFLDLSGMKVFLFLPLILGTVFSCFIPLYRVARKYE